MSIAISFFLIVVAFVFFFYYKKHRYFGEEILKEINNDEILVHFIYDKDFGGKKMEEDRLTFKNLFLPNKGGVSHQRHRYCNENKSKFYAKKDISDKKFAGFVIFNKKCFEVIKKSYITNERPEFEAEIVSTPLDVNNNYLPENIKVFVESKGNPSHADLKYINPAIIGDETPNIAIRSFSRKLSKVCIIIIDEKSDEIEYNGKPFSEFIVDVC